MPEGTAKKICIVAMSLGGGGAERASGMLSKILAGLGYKVCIVTVMNKVEFPYAGELFNLGKLKPEKNTRLSRLGRFRILKKYLKENQFDYIIDTRTRVGHLKEFMISKMLFDPRKTIYVVHSSKLEAYLSSSSIFGKILYGNAFRIIAVSQSIASKIQKIYNVKNVTTIYNAFDVSGLYEEPEQNIHNKKYILFYGRLDDNIKNITLLLEAYSISQLKENDIGLRILGEGRDKGKLKQKVENLNLGTHVEFLPHTNNPFHIVSNAYAVILTSRYEGFPMVIVEALSLGVPVISVDCETGPNEIIIHEENGLLVENHNPKALASAFNRFVADNELYLRCKANAVNSVKRFTVEEIGKEWKRLIN